MLRNYAKENNLNLAVGVDEVGRGPLAGPVVTAAVILPPNFTSELIKDSKKIKSPAKMKQVYDLIMDNAIAVSCNAVSAKKIDEIGIEEAIWTSMHLSIDDLGGLFVPEVILVDGNRFKEYTSPETKSKVKHVTVVKGDNTYLSIAAASIVAKYRRDEYMSKLDELYPSYGFKSNNGYGTKPHIEAIKECGVCRYHRMSYLTNILS